MHVLVCICSNVRLLGGGGGAIQSSWTQVPELRQRPLQMDAPGGCHPPQTIGNWFHEQSLGMYDTGALVSGSILGFPLQQPKNLLTTISITM